MDLTPFLDMQAMIKFMGRAAQIVSLECQMMIRSLAEDGSDSLDGGAGDDLLGWWKFWSITL